MAVAGEMDPGIELEVIEQSFPIGLLPKQNVNETPKSLDTSKLFSDLWQLRLLEMIVRLTHREQLGSGQPGYDVGSSLD